MTSERLRILVVDADPQSRSFLTENLEDSGYSVAHAENGRRAFDLLSTGGFDAILLDLVLPEMDGFRVLRRLKGDSSLRHIPVIVVKENKNIMRNRLEELPFAPGKRFVVENYWEAVGIMTALKAGVAPASVRTPLRDTKVLTEGET